MEGRFRAGAVAGIAILLLAVMVVGADSEMRDSVEESVVPMRWQDGQETPNYRSNERGRSEGRVRGPIKSPPDAKMSREDMLAELAAEKQQLLSILPTDKAVPQDAAIGDEQAGGEVLTQEAGSTFDDLSAEDFSDAAVDEDEDDSSDTASLMEQDFGDEEDEEPRFVKLLDRELAREAREQKKAEKQRHAVELDEEELEMEAVEHFRSKAGQQLKSAQSMRQLNLDELQGEVARQAAHDAARQAAPVIADQVRRQVQQQLSQIQVAAPANAPAPSAQQGDLVPLEQVQASPPQAAPQQPAPVAAAQVAVAQEAAPLAKQQEAAPLAKQQEAAPLAKQQEASLAVATSGGDQDLDAMKAQLTSLKATLKDLDKKATKQDKVEKVVSAAAAAANVDTAATAATSDIDSEEFSSAATPAEEIETSPVVVESTDKEADPLVMEAASLKSERVAPVQVGDSLATQDYLDSVLSLGSKDELGKPVQVDTAPEEDADDFSADDITPEDVEDDLTTGETGDEAKRNIIGYLLWSSVGALVFGFFGTIMYCAVCNAPRDRPWGMPPKRSYG